MTARRRTIKRRSMRGIAQSVSRKSLRWPEGTVLNFKNSVSFKYRDYEVIIQTSKSGQLCDIQPRLGTIYSDFQGVQLFSVSGSSVGFKLTEALKTEIDKLMVAE